MSDLATEQVVVKPMISTILKHKAAVRKADVAKGVTETMITDKRGRLRRITGGLQGLVHCTLLSGRKIPFANRSLLEQASENRGSGGLGKRTNYSEAAAGSKQSPPGAADTTGLSPQPTPHTPRRSHAAHSCTHCRTTQPVPAARTPARL